MELRLTSLTADLSDAARIDVHFIEGLLPIFGVSRVSQVAGSGYRMFLELPFVPICETRILSPEYLR